MNAEGKYDLICIGSGPAGQRAAVQAAKLGKRVAVVERRRVVGGVCIETGTIPSKTFREAVRLLARLSASDDGLGFAPKQQPGIQQLLSRVRDVVQQETRLVREQLQRNRVNVILGDASFVGPHEVRVETDQGDRILEAAHVLIAVGTRCVKPEGVDPDGRVLILPDGILDLRRLPGTVTVVGGGVIGIEYASMFAALGIDVTVIDQRDRLLPFLDSEIVDELVHQLRNQDVTFRLGDRVERTEIATPDSNQALIELASGKCIVSDLVLFSAGRVGATENLGLDTAGISPDDRGRIAVDPHFRTAVPHIYAAGDVIGFPSLAATSSEQGRLAARHMFNETSDQMAAHFPIGIYAIPEISMVGKTEGELTDAKVPYEVGVGRFREVARAKIDGDSGGLLKMLFHSDTRALLGVHIIGAGATELIHIGQAVMALDGGLDYFINTVFNYPTLAECYKVAALDAMNKLAYASEIRNRRSPSTAP